MLDIQKLKRAIEVGLKSVNQEYLLSGLVITNNTESNEPVIEFMINNILQYSVYSLEDKSLMIEGYHVIYNYPEEQDDNSEFEICRSNSPCQLIRDFILYIIQEKLDNAFEELSLESMGHDF